MAALTTTVSGMVTPAIISVIFLSSSEVRGSSVRTLHEWARAHALLDALAQIGVDVAKVFDGALQHRLGHTVEQVSNDVGDQPISLGVIHDVADQSAGLAPVVIVGSYDFPPLDE